MYKVDGQTPLATEALQTEDDSLNITEDSTQTLRVLSSCMQTLQSIYIPDVGTCFSAIQLVEAVTGKDRNDSRVTIKDILISNAGTTLKMTETVLHRKHEFPGFIKPTWVVTHDEACKLMFLLPKKFTHGYLDHVHHLVGKSDKDYTKTFSQALETAKQQNFDKQAQAGYVYAAFSECNGLKIGMTCNENPMKRIRSLNTAVRNPYTVVDFIRCANPGDVERFVHELLQTWRSSQHNRELFQLPPAAASIIFAKLRSAAEEMETTEDDVMDIAYLHKNVKFTIEDLDHFETA
jgi:hypothetical protein